MASLNDVQQIEKVELGEEEEDGELTRGYRTLAEIDADPGVELLNICNTAAHLLRDRITTSLSHHSGLLQDSFNQKIEDLEKSLEGVFTPSNLSISEPQQQKNEEESGPLSNGDVDSSPVEDSQSKPADPKTPPQDSGPTQDTASPPPPSSPVPSPTEEKKTAVPSKADSKIVTTTTTQQQQQPPPAEPSKPCAEIPHKVQKKNQKNAAATKKKVEKTAEQVLRSLGSGPAEERLRLLCEKHAAQAEELREAQARQRACERGLHQMTREKEQLQTEHSRALLARSRLEGLCRELQHQNRNIKEESLAKLREEEERRKELAAKFQSALQEMGATVREQNGQLREENGQLAGRLQELASHYEAAEQQAARLVRHKEVEAQLHRAKFAQAGLELRQAQELHQRERQQLLATVAELQARCSALSASEAALRSELASYTAKYSDFQEVLSKSNSVFASFKKDMDSMTKKIKKLEKETKVWKEKWESSNNTLKQMVADKERRDQENSVAQVKVAKLEKLCRALQAERNQLHKKLTSSTPDCPEDSASQEAECPVEEQTPLQEGATVNDNNTPSSSSSVPDHNNPTELPQ